MRRLLTASLSHTNSGTTLLFAYDSASASSITGTDDVLAFSTGGGEGINVTGLTILPLVVPNGVAVSVPTGVNTIEISNINPSVGTATFSTVGALNVAETLQIDNSVYQAAFQGAVTAGGILANAPMDLNGGTAGTMTSGQTYKYPVILTADTTINASGPDSNVTFEQTVDSQAGSYYGLTVLRSGRDLVRGQRGHDLALGLLDRGGRGDDLLGFGKHTASGRRDGHRPADGCGHPGAVARGCRRAFPPPAAAARNRRGTTTATRTTRMRWCCTPTPRSTPW